MLHRYAIALSLFIALAGCGAGYLVASSLHSELRDISSLLSALRQTAYKNPTFPEQAQVDTLIYSAGRMNEIAPLVSAAVRDALQLQFSTEDTSCFYQMQPNDHVTPTKTEPIQDAEFIRTGTEQASAVLTAAIDMGIWNQNSAQAFAVALQALPDAELAEAYRKLSQAINNGDLQLPEEIDPSLLLTGIRINSQ